jgi:hypothetical protein
MERFASGRQKDMLLTQPSTTSAVIFPAWPEVESFEDSFRREFGYPGYQNELPEVRKGDRDPVKITNSAGVTLGDVAAVLPGLLRRANAMTRHRKEVAVRFETRV